MIRLNLILAAVLMLSAITLVTVRYQSREWFVQVEQLKSRSHDLDVDWRRLQLERAELARNARIDALARKQLHLVAVTPGRTLYVKQEPDGGQP